MQESLRLWLLCSACADNAAAAEKQEATRTECQPQVELFKLKRLGGLYFIY